MRNVCIVYKVLICCHFRVAVGSPRANTSALNYRTDSLYKFDDKSSGALYKCPIDMDPSNCVDITVKIQQCKCCHYNNLINKHG